ncbi:THUMP domain-containing class I SAM-dependent RNA methyltransferase [Sulfurirhabdus autotrophica]|uniref:Putative N6-adenine-specific DNA methylase n=1 Tax=Sulfurirhabdus autotrophica TaxID=1706046 RepID=A0A4R3YBH0_9PROT|nr:THUMP domain-containing protein [Sulfurirhabdus autotrophica]TCV88084.1 putative N6-adenine-specific DNA methylase [Sulfurirhabdus autotrophica]
MNQETHRFFAPCPRGLETPLNEELTQLGAQFVKQTDGGVSFSGPFTLCYRVNLESRIASRVLWQVAHGGYRSEEDVYKAVFSLPWNDWFSVDRTIMVKVSAQRCPLRSLDFVTLKIKDAVCDKFRENNDGKRPSVNTAEPDIRIHAFLDESNFTLYLDTSGQALFKRGLRQVAGEAPIRENLAAGIIMLSGWKPGVPFLDPMCGSGTFLMEAAQMALNISPGLGRNFAFEKMNNFDSQAWAAMRQESEAKQLPRTTQPIYGSDLFGEMLNLAKENIEAAGLSEVISLNQANVVEISPPAEEGVLVTNPPYGVRLDELERLAEFYPRLGDALKQKFAGWNAYIFTADLRLPNLIRLTTSRRTPLFNGALECRLFEYKVVAGGMRREKPEKA